MEENNKSIEDIKAIRQMMEKSGSFLSLSGLSGVFAGIYSIIGAFVSRYFFINSTFYVVGGWSYPDLIFKIFIISFIIIVLSITTSIIFTIRKSNKLKRKIWNSLSKEMILHFTIPMFVGGIVCIFCLDNTMLTMLIPSITLIFYGLALVSASKYTFVELKYLGLLELVLGLICFYDFTLSFYLWVFGFGVLHIVYGAWMYFKYDRNIA